MSALALAMYWVDKRRATRGMWRISEGTLHTIELLGGWPGAWLGQRIFRHKWRKPQYLVVFWIIVTVHMVAWVLYFVFAAQDRRQVRAQLGPTPDSRSSGRCLS
jgi:uncharacterized membrane protein YsdA (DUF1294 family)